MKHQDKVLADRRLWRASDKARDYDLRTKFNITLEEYNQMLTEQNNLCAICKGPQKMGKKNFAVDHNHETDAIRGLLCNRCNMALGLVKEDTGLLMDMVSYLTYHSVQKESDSWATTQN